MSYQSIKAKVAALSGTVTVIAVSKYHSVAQMNEVYEQGCRDFGESRVQEALDKMEQMPTDIRWHLIGSLQKNKVRKVIGKFALIHSVDSFDLAKKISECSEELGVTTGILLQTNTSGELSKRGLTAEEWQQCFPELLLLPNLKIEGLMTMAPMTGDQEIIRRCFADLRRLRDQLADRIVLPQLSMGMSHDYEVAIQEGATLVRIGSAIFK